MAQTESLKFSFLGTSGSTRCPIIIVHSVPCSMSHFVFLQIYRLMTPQTSHATTYDPLRKEDYHASLISSSLVDLVMLWADHQMKIDFPRSVRSV